MDLYAAQDRLNLGNRTEGKETQDVIGQSRQNWQDLGHRDQSGGGFQNQMGRNAVKIDQLKRTRNVEYILA